MSVLSFKMMLTPQQANSRLGALLTVTALKLFLLAPHFVCLLAAVILSVFCALFGLLWLLMTGRYPRQSIVVIVGTSGWIWRVLAYFCCLTDRYPALGLGDRGRPAWIQIDGSTHCSRLDALLTLTLVKSLMLLPILLVWLLGSVVALACGTLNVGATLFRGRLHEPCALFITAHARLGWRMLEYQLCLTGRHPALEFWRQEDALSEHDVAALRRLEWMRQQAGDDRGPGGRLEKRVTESLL